MKQPRKEGKKSRKEGRKVVKEGRKEGKKKGRNSNISCFTMVVNIVHDDMISCDVM